MLGLNGGNALNIKNVLLLQLRCGIASFKMAKRWESPRLCSRKKCVQIKYNTSYSLEFKKKYDWVKKIDRGALQAYCTLFSMHFSISHSGLNDVMRYSNQSKEKQHNELYSARNQGNKMMFLCVIKTVRL